MGKRDGGGERHWFEGAVFYSLPVQAFADGNGDGKGDFAGLRARLDYLVALGVDCLWLLPFYASPRRDGGYDVADFRQVHPDCGTLDDCRAFLAAAHRAGLRVLVDLVLNHTSAQHPWFESARSSPSSPHRDYYVWSDSPDRYAAARVIFADYEESNWTWDAAAGQYYWHRFFAEQPDLNYDNPAVAEEMLAVARFWLAAGVDGFRLDAVPFLYERESTDCENLAETHAFLRRLRREVAAMQPGCLLLAEASQSPALAAEYFGAGDECQMALHFGLMPAALLALTSQEAMPLRALLARLPASPASSQWGFFLRNHDELSLKGLDEAQRALVLALWAPEPSMRLKTGVRRRLAPLLRGDRRAWELLHVLLLTLPGSPVLYYGDELALGDDLGLPDRDGLRLALPWGNAGVAGQQHDPASTLNWLCGALAARRRLGRGERQTRLLATDDPAVLAYLVEGEALHQLVLLNFAAAASEVHLDLRPWTGARRRWALGGDGAGDGTMIEGVMAFSLPPLGYRWDVLRIRAQDDG
ncbi:MAG: alpha-amylase family glycosyl hydrolase [Chloroflexota bacterium]